MEQAREAVAQCAEACAQPGGRFLTRRLAAAARQQVLREARTTCVFLQYLVHRLWQRGKNNAPRQERAGTHLQSGDAHSPLPRPLLLAEGSNARQAQLSAARSEWARRPAGHRRHGPGERTGLHSGLRTETVGSRIRCRSKKGCAIATCMPLAGQDGAQHAWQTRALQRPSGRPECPAAQCRRLQAGRHAGPHSCHRCRRSLFQLTR